MTLYLVHESMEFNGLIMVIHVHTIIARRHYKDCVMGVGVERGGCNVA